MTKNAKTLTWLILMVAMAPVEAEVAYQLDRERSLFAVITHPAGTAAGLGHHHLISATNYVVELGVDEDQLSASHFKLSVPAASLAVDTPAIAAEVFPRLRALEIVDRNFPELSAEDKATMRERMLSPSQLDAAHAPMIGAHVEEIGAAGGSFAGHDFPSTVVLNLTIRGKTVARPIPATILLRNRKIVANAVGAFRFSEFGIEPFQAALGLLRNDDTFHVYVELVAQRRSEEH